MSAILSASDLNDFITPGLACIKPAGEVRLSSNNTEANYEIQINDAGEALEVSIDDGSVQNLPSASISLQDCLACSGCITSAEEVLLAKQTHKVLLEDLAKYSNEKIFCMSISHQSRISISDVFGIPVFKVDEFLINFFSEKYGFKFIVGTELGRVLSLNKMNSDLIQKKVTSSEKVTSLSSICPGFVLYVEKTKPEILPYLLNVKSPQQITGLLLKSLISKQLNITGDKIYHLSIMPCFDKKLEAARPELNGDKVQDVDCVLTPKEFIELIKEESINHLEYLTKAADPPYSLYQQASPNHWPSPIESWSSNIGSASGGYALSYILSLQSYYSEQGLSNTLVREVNGKNSDVLEYQLINLENNEKLGSSAIVNGFRNIQNLVRKLKPSGKVKIGSGLQARRKARMVNKNGGSEDDASADPSSCDFVEVMACPGGCINGGGVNQVSLSETTSNSNNNSKDHMNQLAAKYDEEFEEIKELKQVGLLSQYIEEFTKIFGIDEKRIFNYKFNAVEKATDILSVGSKW